MAQEVVFADRIGTNSLKWDGYEGVFHRDDLLPLWVADMDFCACEPIQKALARRLTHHVYGYPYADDGFYEAIIYWHQKRYGETVEREWIVPLSGVVAGIYAALEILTAKGDKIAVMPPVYGPFFSVPREMERVVVEVPLIVNERVEIDFETLETALSSQEIKALIFCHPHNPLGKVWTKEQLNTLVELCDKYGCKVISDEIHSDTLYDSARHQPLYALTDGAICLFAPTKTFNIPGLNVAYAIIKDEKSRKRYEKIAHAMHITLPNAFGIEALKAAYFEGDEWLKAVLKTLESNKKIVVDFFKDKPYAKVYEPQATYLAWIDFAPCGLDASQIRKKLLDDARVGLSGGDFFYGGKSTTCHRLNFATSPDVLLDSLQKINGAFGY